MFRKLNLVLRKSQILECLLVLPYHMVYKAWKWMSSEDILWFELWMSIMQGWFLGYVFLNQKSTLYIYAYHISANSFRGNYSFLNLTLCTVTFDHSTYRCGNYSRVEIIRGNTVFNIFEKSKLNKNWNIHIYVALYALSNISFLMAT